MSALSVELRGEGRLAGAIGRALEAAGFELVERGGERAVALQREEGRVVVALTGRGGSCVLRAVTALRGWYPPPWRRLFEELMTGRPVRLAWRAQVDLVTREDLVAAVVLAVQERAVGDWRVPSAAAIGELALGRALLVETGSSSLLVPAVRSRLGGVGEARRLPGFLPRSTAEEAARAWIALYQKDRSDV